MILPPSSAVFTQSSRDGFSFHVRGDSFSGTRRLGLPRRENSPLPLPRARRHALKQNAKTNQRARHCTLKAKTRKRRTGTKTKYIEAAVKSEFAVSCARKTVTGGQRKLSDNVKTLVRKIGGGR